MTARLTPLGGAPPRASVRRQAHALVALLVCATVMLPAGTAADSAPSFHIAGQYNLPHSRGYCLGLEGSQLAGLQLTLWVGDGESWRSSTSSPGFEFGRDYQIHAVLTATYAELLLDGSPVTHSHGGWEPAASQLELTYRPSWSDEPEDWAAVVSDLSVVLTRNGEEVARHEFGLTVAAQRMPLPLFDPGPPRQATMECQPGDSVTIDAVIRFGRSELAAYAPIIDRYGQCLYAEFPEKVHSDADLLADIAAEEAILETMPPSADFDRYGGSLSVGWREEATGFFRVVKRDDYWWLISPEGNPCFYIGINNVRGPSTPTAGREFLFEWLPPRESPWSAAWVDDPSGLESFEGSVIFSTANLIRKYGENDWWKDANEIGRRRLQSWGFSGGGKWDMPYGFVLTPVLWTSTTPTLAGHPDFFDPAVQELFRSELAGWIEPRRDDPRILGWSYQNEYAAIITRDEICQILAKPADTPSKRALLDYSLDELYAGAVAELADAWELAVTNREELYAATPTPPESDIERLRCWYADGWYGFVYATIKDIDPNHLVIAPWCVPTWWESEQDWYLQARHCDVMGYDRYAMSYEDAEMARLKREIDVPTFCGEFSFPPTYSFVRGYGLYHSSWADDDADAGQRYYDWVSAAARDPSCVGLSWFQYRDQPLTGRGPGYGPDLVYGEHYAFGAVTVTDRPKWPLVRRMRDANLQAAQWRLAASGRPFVDVPPDHWAASEIAACMAAGIVAGYPDGTYQPDLSVTRDQMAIYIARALAGGEAHVPSGPAQPSFSDVPSDSVAYKYIEYAVTSEVVLGYPDGLYHPECEVDRGQMAVFVARATATPTGEPGMAAYIPPAAPTFADVTPASADPYRACYKYVELLAASGVAHGYPDGLYHPAYMVSRGQMAIYLARAFDLPLS